MRRDVSTRLTATVGAPTTVTLVVAVADGADDEQLTVTLDGVPLTVRELVDPYGSRLHVVTPGPGRLVVDYRAVVHGRRPPPPVDDLDLLVLRRPSRYCESDTLAATARAELAGPVDADLLAAVSSWVGTRLAYLPGSSQPIDGAVATLLARRGVCRDYAHLVVALLRALDVPARVVAVYAPGLAPMDFHAVAEAYVAGGWQVVDATTLAPRSTMLRVATGRDAADTAFLTVHGGAVTLDGLEVGAVADRLPDDDVTKIVALG